MPDHPHMLIATLGGQPQVVTFTLDLLLRAGFPISKVVAVHPRASGQSRISRSLQRLSAEFAHNDYAATGRSIDFSSHALEIDGRSIEDITNDAHADGTLDTIHQLIGERKRQGYRIHLSVTGGRRLMALLAIPIALFNFDRHDHIWHLYTPDAVRAQADQGQIMHVSPDAGVKLIQGPFIPLGAYAYASAQPFRVAQEERSAQLEAQERARCAEVASKATRAQLKVLQAFARGLRPQQVCDELCITLATVNTHKTAILSHCHSAWNIPDAERLDYHFLAARFGNYFPANE